MYLFIFDIFLSLREDDLKILFILHHSKEEECLSLSQLSRGKGEDKYKSISNSAHIIVQSEMFAYFRTSLVRIKFLCRRPLLVKKHNNTTTSGLVPSVQKITSVVLF